MALYIIVIQCRLECLMALYIIVIQCKIDWNAFSRFK